MEQSQQQAEPMPGNALQQSVAQQCCDQAQNPPSLFTLTVPVGGGKTFSSLAFALQHAERFGKLRVVCAISYTSIINETASPILWDGRTLALLSASSLLVYSCGEKGGRSLCYRFCRHQ